MSALLRLWHRAKNSVRTRSMRLFHRLSFLPFILRNPRLKYRYYRYAIFMSDRGFQPWYSSSVAATEHRWETQGMPASSDNPETYTKADRSQEELFADVLGYLSAKSPILEIGCNVGRSLQYLYERGFTNLTGIEIGAKAVELGRKVFPDMAAHSRLILGNAAEEIRKIPTESCDLVFCHSVLVNVHPGHNSIFKEMARVSRKFILTLESEGSLFAYPRDFQKQFEAVGYKQVVFKILTGASMSLPIPFTEKDIYHNNTIRLFVRDQSRNAGLQLEGQR